LKSRITAGVEWLWQLIKYGNILKNGEETVTLLNLTPPAPQLNWLRRLSGASDTDAMLVVAAGDTKIDNGKFKREFGFKAAMLKPEETLEFTGHPVGGVCPFGLKKAIPVFLDISLKRFDRVFPACGSVNSVMELTCEELAQYASSKKWIDVCKNWSGIDSKE
jgi:hypothetical protein